MNDKKAKLLRKLCKENSLPRYCYRSLKKLLHHEPRQVYYPYVLQYASQFTDRLQQHVNTRGDALEYMDVAGKVTRIEVQNEG